MTVHRRIEMRPDVMLGKPVIRGTRVRAELVLRKLAEGATLEDLLDGYPSITRDDVHAAIQFAADTPAHEEVVFRPAGTEREGTGQCDASPTRAATSRWFGRCGRPVTTLQRLPKTSRG